MGLGEEVWEGHLVHNGAGRGGIRTGRGGIGRSSGPQWDWERRCGEVIWSIMGLGEEVLGLGEEMWGGHLVHNVTGS